MRKNVLFLLLTFALLAWAGPSNVAAENISFGPSIKVTDSTYVAVRACPSMAVDSCGNVNVVWEDCRGGLQSIDIYFARSTDEGSTWGPNIRVNDEFPGNCIIPSLDVDGSGNLYVAWEQEGDGNVYFSMSVDNGKTWTEDVRVNEDVPGWQGAPSLAVDPDGNIYVTWSDGRNGLSDIYFARSTDAGSTWTIPNVRVNSPSSGYQLLSHTAVGNSGSVYAVWDDSRAGVDDIFFSMSTDGGGTWSADVRVNDDEHRHVDDPHVAVGKDGVIYVVWQSGGIFFAKSTDDGQTWTLPNIKVHSDSLGIIQYQQPCVSVDDEEKVYVVWKAYNGQDYTPHIYFAMSIDSGNTWTGPEMRVDDSLCIGGEYPSLDVGPLGKVYVVWDGWRITVHPTDVYFALGETINTIATEPPQNEIPKTFKLSQNYPNPFNPTTMIRYTIPGQPPLSHPQRVSLKIHNILGKEIRSLVKDEQRPGSYTVCWDGKDNRGNEVGSGIYFCKFQCGDFMTTKKLVLLK